MYMSAVVEFGAGRNFPLLCPLSSLSLSLSPLPLPLPLPLSLHVVASRGGISRRHLVARPSQSDPTDRHCTAVPPSPTLPYLSYTNLRLRGTTTNYDYISTSLSAPSALTTDSETYII